MLRKSICAGAVFIGALLPFLIASRVLAALSANRLYTEPGVDVLASVEPAFGDKLHLWWRVWLPGIATLAAIAACVIMPRGRESTKNRYWRFATIFALTVVAGLVFAGPWIHGVVRVQRMPVYAGYVF